MTDYMSRANSKHNCTVIFALLRRWTIITKESIQVLKYLLTLSKLAVCLNCTVLKDILG